MRPPELYMGGAFIRRICLNIVSADLINAGLVSYATAASHFDWRIADLRLAGSRKMSASCML